MEPLGYRIAHRALCRLQLKPRTPGPRDEGLEDELAEIRAQPTASWHQQHGLLFVPTLAEGNQKRAFRSPCRRPYVQVPDLGGTDNNQEVVRLLRRREHALEEHFILSLPYAWLRALKDAIDHSQRMIRVEASNAIESHMTDNPRPVPDLPTDGNSCCIAICRARKAPPLALVLSKAPAPNTPKAGHANYHSCHAPFPTLLFSPAPYNSSFSRLI